MTAMTNEKRWTIFLSHSSSDKDFACWLRSKLLSAELSVWFDADQISVGDSIVAKIAEGLQGSELLIVVLSNRALNSAWVKAELEPKILEQVEAGKTRILPVLLGKCRPDQLPTLLRSKKWIQFPRKGSEPKFRQLLGDIETHLEQRGIPSANQTIKSILISASLNNPFGLLGGVDAEYFVVPERLLNEVTADLVKKQSVSLVGARMMGKTSLLKFLSHRRCQTYYRRGMSDTPSLKFVYLDLQEQAGKSRDELLVELARLMTEARPMDEPFQGRTHEEAMAWIKRAAGRRSREGLFWAVLIDEFDRVTDLDGVDKAFFDNLRSLPQHYNLSFVVASRRKLIDLPLPADSSTSPFFNIFQEHFLTTWDEATARELMFNPAGKQLKVFSGEDAIFLARLTANHPALLQRACATLFEARQENPGRKPDYIQVRERYIQKAEVIYRWYWEYELTEPARAWVRECWREHTESTRQMNYKTANGTHRTIRLQLMRLGFVLNDDQTISFPEGVKLYLEGLDRN